MENKMSTRNEPTVGNFLVNASNFVLGKKVTSHEALVEDALSAFTKAETQMGDAINQIQLQIDEEERAIEEAQKRVLAATGSIGKLDRVLKRVQAFTA
jgi:hypothetical protein